MRKPETASAHALLDDVAAGKKVPAWQITAALVETGDVVVEDEDMTRRFLTQDEWAGVSAPSTPATWASIIGAGS